MLRWKQWPTDHCPRCGVAREDAIHVLQCPDSEAVNRWKLSIDNLRDWMLSHQTEPTFCEFICHSLLTWHTSDNQPFISANADNDYLFPGLSSLFESTSPPTFTHIISGLVPTTWSDVQQRYYNWLDSKHTGKRWLSSLIIQLFNISWDQWEHRNGHVHSQSSSVDLTNQLRQRVRDMLAQPNRSLSRHDWSVFQQGHQLQTSDNQPVLQAWLAYMESATQRGNRRDVTTFKPERQALRRWLLGSRGHR
jgi:hypothetical protein